MGHLHGRLIRQHRSPVAIQYSTGGMSWGGVPAYLELFNLSEPLAEDEELIIEGADGCIYNCRRLDGSNICAITDVGRAT